MDVLTIFGFIFAIMFIGFFAEIIFKKFNIPDVLILILLGILLKTVLGFVDSSTFGEGASLFTTFALVFILFQGAINIDFKTLIKSLKNTLFLTITSFVLTVFIVSIISYFLGYNVKLAMLIGIILAGTSSAVVIPLVNNINIRDKYGLVLTLESAISDVLCIVGTITILDIIESGEFITSSVFKNVLSSFSLALVVGVTMGSVWIYLLYKNEELLKAYMLTIAVVMGLYAFVESSYVGSSGAIAVLAFGLILGNSRSILNVTNKKAIQKSEEEPNMKVLRSVLSPSAKNFYLEISFFVKTFFFVYLGILIDFSNLMIFLYGFIISLGIFLIRPFAVKLVFANQKVEVLDRALMEILIPKGLAAAVLAQLVVQSGILGELAGNFVNLILSVVLISIMITSVLIFFTQKNIFKGFFYFLINSEIKKK